MEIKEFLSLQIQDGKFIQTIKVYDGGMVCKRIDVEIYEIVNGRLERILDNKEIK